MKSFKSVVNGIVGDYLVASNNELAVKMAFYHGEKPLLDITNILKSSSNSSNQRICIFVHGLADDESTWNASGQEYAYGTLLEQELGIVPLYLRYNTGLHISTNGQNLSDRMESLVKDNEKWMGEIIFVCHSMGGLVTRSALHYNSRQILEEDSSSSTTTAWSQRVSRVIFLGSPHQGSHWEQLGNLVSTAIGAVPRPYMKLTSQIANLRSSGIQDLRYGYILDDEWQEPHQGSFTNNKKPAILPDWIQYHVITGTVTTNPDHFLSHAIGDGLVRKPSALGSSHIVDHDLALSHAAVEFPGVNHAKLSHDPAVYSQIKEWVERPVLALPAFLEDGSTEEEQVAVDVTMDVRDDAMEVDRSTSSDDPNEDKEKNDKHYYLDDDGRGKWADHKGAAALAQDAVCYGVVAVQGVHLDLTDEIFDIVAGVIRPISPVVRRIQSVHNLSVASIYGIVHAVGYGSGEIAKGLCECMDERRRTTKADDGRETNEERRTLSFVRSSR
jgi:pimeloyl-ACP methyl ester carboxylesterase